MKVRTYFYTTATVSVTVNVSDEQLAKLADDNGCTVEELDDDMIIEFASNEASTEGFGGLCAHCSGWGRSWSQDLNDWEPNDEPGDIIER